MILSFFMSFLVCGNVWAAVWCSDVYLFKVGQANWSCHDSPPNPYRRNSQGPTLFTSIAQHGFCYILVIEQCSLLYRLPLFFAATLHPSLNCRMPEATTLSPEPGNYRSTCSTCELSKGVGHIDSDDGDNKLRCEMNSLYARNSAFDIGMQLVANTINKVT